MRPVCCFKVVNPSLEVKNLITGYPFRGHNSEFTLLEGQRLLK